MCCFAVTLSISLSLSFLIYFYSCIIQPVVILCKHQRKKKDQGVGGWVEPTNVSSFGLIGQFCIDLKKFSFIQFEINCFSYNNSYICRLHN